MSRKLLWLYNAIFLTAAVIVLGALAPPLMAEPLSFSAVYLPMLALILVMSLWVGRLATGIIGSIVYFLAFGLMGAPGWVIMAWFMLWITIIVRAKTATAVDAAAPDAATTRITPVGVRATTTIEDAARQV